MKRYIAHKDWKKKMNKARGPFALSGKSSAIFLGRLRLYLMEGQVGMMHEAVDELHGSASATTRWLDANMCGTSRAANRCMIQV